MLGKVFMLRVGSEIVKQCDWRWRLLGVRWLFVYPLQSELFVLTRVGSFRLQYL